MWISKKKFKKLQEDIQNLQEAVDINEKATRNSIYRIWNSFKMIHKELAVDLPSSDSRVSAKAVITALVKEFNISWVPGKEGECKVNQRRTHK